ncbi:YqaE/Pmp3 family membrane protein [uncultured Winogradskyella sp.]|uniref:YqaE/Pmp3 family membrane protein n=1 Tax=uncultured Winogradskyella sp. TaxID=395353 RepID=UPI00260ED490|nr:YqaE/Pmp3 family membrane protein [uncultured Winogradskyella sp.]
MSLLTIVLSIILPPLGVFLKQGMGSEFLISIILTVIGWLPGVIYAFYVNSK